MNKPKKLIAPVQIIRRITQFISFLLWPGLFSNTLYAIKELYMAVIEGSFTFTEMIPQILLLMSTVLITIFMGRFFCGFVCSFGSMGDLLWFLSQKTIKPNLKIGERVDAVLKLLKYGILLFIIICVWTLSLITFDSLDNPWTIFGMYATIGNWPSLQYLLSLGGLLLLLIIIGSFFIERLFCKYLCPLGAIFAITSKLRLFHIKKDRTKCGSCRMCTSKCSMGIPLYKYDKVTSAECINCFACVNHCPKKNAKANPAPAVTSAVSVATIMGLVYVGNIASDKISENKTTISTSPKTTSGRYIAGTYTGTASGFRGDTVVSVTVENGNISDISVVSYEDDNEYFNRAKNTIISDIIESQEVYVDAVSGATFSSNGIINAIADALNITTDTTSNSTQDFTIDSTITTQDITTDSTNTTQDITTDTTSNVTNDSITNDVNSTESTDDSNSSTLDTQVYQDGTYTGIGTGFRGETELSVTVSNGNISDITVISYADDQEFFTQAKDKVISAIIKNQDTNVDAVSGATYSSNGIMEAVADALGVSYTNSNDTNRRGKH